MAAGALQTRRPRPSIKLEPSGADRPHLVRFEVRSTLPYELRGLERLARNFWWTWNPDAEALFRDLSPLSWESSERNPVTFLQRAYPVDLEARATDRAYLDRLEGVLARFDAYLAGELTAEEDGVSEEHPVAYFCAEYGIHASLRIYSGGLGVLAGDHLKSASDLGVPLVAVGSSTASATSPSASPARASRSRSSA